MQGLSPFQYRNEVAQAEAQVREAQDRIAQLEQDLAKVRKEFAASEEELRRVQIRETTLIGQLRTRTTLAPSAQPRHTLHCTQCGKSSQDVGFPDQSRTRMTNRCKLCAQKVGGMAKAACTIPKKRNRNE